MKVIAFFDGNCRLGDRGAGAAIVYDVVGNELARGARYIEGDDVTNNIAEYRGLILAFDLARQVGAHEVRVFGDSELIIRQFNRIYACRKPHLQTHLMEAWSACLDFSEVLVEELPRSGATNKRREGNMKADALATQCMRAGQDL